MTIDDFKMGDIFCATQGTTFYMGQILRHIAPQIFEGPLYTYYPQRDYWEFLKDETFYPTFCDRLHRCPANSSTHSLALIRREFNNRIMYFISQYDLYPKSFNIHLDNNVVIEGNNIEFRDKAFAIALPKTEVKLHKLFFK